MDAAKNFSPRMSAMSSPKRRKLSDTGFSLENGVLFSQVHPQGVQLSQKVIQLMEGGCSNLVARTFDELTLEDQPVEFHPNDVVLKSFITRNIFLKGYPFLSMSPINSKIHIFVRAQLWDHGSCNGHCD